MQEVETKVNTRYINNKFNSTWKNMFCWFMNHELATPVKQKGYILDLYEIDDKTLPGIDEVVGIDTTVNPPQSISASGSWSCTVSMSGNLGGNTSTTTKTIKVYPKLKRALVMDLQWKLIYDVDALSIVIMAEDMNVT